MSLRCPRCAAALSPADDLGVGVLACTCGAFFVTREARVKLLAWLRIGEDTWTLVLEQGKRGPGCACGATMQTASLKGVTVDGCASCGGLLLDPGELRSLTGLEEGARAGGGPDQGASPARAADAVPEPHGLGRVFVPSRQALATFAGSSLAYHLLQSKSEIGGGVLGLPVNQPFQWTVSSGMATATIGPDDDSVARQLLAFVTGNLVSSRFLLRDGRDDPMLALLRKTRALINAQLEVRWADDEQPLGEITRSVVGFALDIADARGAPVLRFEKHLGDLWGFSVVDPRNRKIGDVARGFSNVELDVSVLGGFGLERSVRRDDFTLTFHEDVPLHHKALAVAATFLVAHTSSGPGGIMALFK